MFLNQYGSYISRDELANNDVILARDLKPGLITLRGCCSFCINLRITDGRGLIREGEIRKHASISGIRDTGMILVEILDV